MFKAWFVRASIPAGGIAWSPNDIPLVRARTVSITCRCTYAAGATGALKVNIYYSPNGKVWDTVPVDDFTVDLTAGSTVQKTYLAAVPEHGYLKVKLENQDTGNAVTNVRVWYSIQSWEGVPKQEVGAITKDVGEE